MRTRLVSLQSPDHIALRRASHILGQGGVILSPTDTIYGLSCDPFKRGALEKILKIKNRPTGKGFLLLVSSVDQARELTSGVPPAFDILARHCWPGPLTMVLDGRTTLPRLLTGEGGQIGCRLPKSNLLQGLLAEYGSPLVSTSANLSGQPPPGSIDELRQTFGNSVDLFLEAGDCHARSPSTVVDLTVEPPQVLREGGGVEIIERILRRLRKQDSSL